MSFKMFRIGVISFFLLFSMTACRNDSFAPSIQGESGEFFSSGDIPLESHPEMQENFETFCTDLFRKELEVSSTLDLHYTLLHPEAYNIHQEHAALGTYSLSGLIQNIQDVRDLKKQLAAFDRDFLTEDEKLLFDALTESAESSLLFDGLELYGQPLAPTIGIQAQLPILLAEYSFHSVQDVEDYLSLLSQLDAYFKEILTFEKQKADAGLGPSDVTIDRIIDSCNSYLIDPEHNFLTETFASRLQSLETSVPLSAQQKEDFTNRHLLTIRDSFLPAYQHMIEELAALKGRGINDRGLAGFRYGKQYYESLVRSMGLSYHIEGLRSALSDRMNCDLETISALSKKTDLSSHFHLTDSSAILSDLQKQMRRDFPALENGHDTYEIRNVPESLEQTLSPAFYLTAPVDAPDQNVIYINNGSTDASENLYPTLAHEGFPGHLYQTVYFREHMKHPLSALFTSSAANEGWATYVEQLSYLYDNGLSKKDGMYQAAMRSFSLCFHSLLDIGIHYDGWTKEEAADFIRTYFEADDALIEELWQTIIDNPANYLEYAGGYVEIMEMREEAQKTLGDHFSARDFHKFLLDLGPVPFSVSRKYFPVWLSKQPQ